MRAFVEGKVKEIKEDGILIQYKEEEILVLNRYDNSILDFSQLELRVGDIIKAIGTATFISDSEMCVFAPHSVENKRPDKYIPTVFQEFIEDL